MMLTLLGTLAVLLITPFIARRIAADVPDEVELSGQYVRMSVDVIVLLMLATILYTYNHPIAAIVVPALLALVRRIFTLPHVHALATGTLLATATQLPLVAFEMICIMCLAHNYVQGAYAKDHVQALRIHLAQPLCALVVFFAISFL